MTTMAMPRARKDAPMEGMVAKWYASNTAEMMKEYVELAARVAKALPSGSAVLEVAPGPGYFSIELAKRGTYAITGLDLSRTFVELAGRNAAKAGVQARFMQGSASNMPLPRDTFDFLLCRAAFKNFARPVEALKEMQRVLKPGGRGVIIDLKGNASADEIAREVDRMGLTWFNRIMTKLAFRTMLLKRAYTQPQFEAMLAEVSFAKAEIQESNMGLEIWMTK
ncbi:MAG TPA: class I SAM-dependent methyltransferase [Terracidiphilus sp.]|jgi:ubiquinone/menaquinone biosynthesis C-methylase UbiE|nr:class I SAM-dependent methyltransferase [Terracidiphilus sp.]